MIKCGLDQNSQVYLGWELGTDKHEVARSMQRLSGSTGANWSLIKGMVQRGLFYNRPGAGKLAGSCWMDLVGPLSSPSIH